MSDIRLGVNVDHVATIRQARLTDYPNPIEAALAAEKGGAGGITVHLREDRRHIQEADVFGLKAAISTKLNLEMAASRPIVEIACRVGPHDCCLVPEKREELTTEGGLAVAGNEDGLSSVVSRLNQAGIRVSLFIDPRPPEVEAAASVGATAVELHTGTYADCPQTANRELVRLAAAVRQAAALGLSVNAGHGLTLENVAAVAAIDGIEELNIGHSIVARALMVGMEEAVREMLDACRQARGRSPAGNG